MRWTSQRRSISLHPVLIYGHVHHVTNGRKHGRTSKIQWLFWEGTYIFTPLQDCFGRDSSEKCNFNMDLEKVPTWECLSVHRQQSLFVSIHVDDVKMAGKKRDLEPMCKILQKHIDLDKPATFWDAHMKAERESCQRLQKHVRSTNFRRSYRKVA